MATNTAGAAANTSATNKDAEQHPTSSAADVEMSTLNPSSATTASASETTPTPSQPQPQQQTSSPTQTSSTPEDPDTTAGAPSQPAQDPADNDEPTTQQQQPPNLTRLQSEAGLGPATDSPIAPPPLPTADRGPVLSITLMLITGARHPYKIDEKYLRSRKVDAVGSEATAGGAAGGVGGGDFDPREISGYKLKELIWTDWRNEWEPRPASPSSIRLIILGRMVEDKAALKDFPFKLDQTNVVHMTVKPADFLDDDDTGGKGTGKGHSIRGRDDGEGGAGCRCVIL